MRRTFSPAPTARVASRPATTPMSSCSMRPIGATSPTTWRGTWWALSSRVVSSSGRARLAPMATKKQRRRQKDRRHEWEYVYVDDEGEEVEVEEAESPTPRSAEARTKAGKKQSGRAGRSVEPPSWRKVGKRGLLFAPLMLIVVYLLQGKNKDPVAAVYQTIVLLAFFIPFSYLMDTMMYRAFRKRLGGGNGANAKHR